MLKALSSILRSVARALRRSGSYVFQMVDGVLTSVFRPHPVAADTFDEFDTPSIDPEVAWMEQVRAEYRRDLDGARFRQAARLRLDGQSIDALYPENGPEPVERRWLLAADTSLLRAVLRASDDDVHRWLRGRDDAVRAERPEAWLRRIQGEAANQNQQVNIQQIIRDLIQKASAMGDTDPDYEAIEMKAYAIAKAQGLKRQLAA